MMFAIFFIFWRFMQILTLIPMMGMLAWFIDTYVKAQALSPSWLLVIFIVSVLSLVWAIFTMFKYHRSSAHASFIGFIDLLFVGAFIAAVYFLRWIRHQNCTKLSTSGENYTGQFGALGSITISGFNLSTNKPCAMLKTSWALAIMNIFFFFFTAVLAILHGNQDDDDRKHSHRRGGGSKSRRSNSRRGSGSRHSSHRSSHSHSRRSHSRRSHSQSQRVPRRSEYV